MIRNKMSLNIWLDADRDKLMFTLPADLFDTKSYTEEEFKSQFNNHIIERELLEANYTRMPEDKRVYRNYFIEEFITWVKDILLRDTSIENKIHILNDLNESNNLILFEKGVVV